MTKLTKLCRLFTGASLGDWEHYPALCCPDMGGVSTGGNTVCAVAIGKRGHPMTIQDAELIAAMHDALPDLLRVVELTARIMKHAQITYASGYGWAAVNQLCDPQGPLARLTQTEDS